MIQIRKGNGFPCDFNAVKKFKNDSCVKSSKEVIFLEKNPKVVDIQDGQKCLFSKL